MPCDGSFSTRRSPPGQQPARYFPQFALKGGDFQSKWSAPVAVPEKGAAKLDLALTDKRAADLGRAGPRRLPNGRAESGVARNGRTGYVELLN